MAFHVNISIDFDKKCQENAMSLLIEFVHIEHVLTFRKNTQL